MKKSLISLLLFAFTIVGFSQSASVAPTRLYYKNDIGEVATKRVTVKNKSKDAQSYKIFFGDFEVENKKGKPTLMGAEESVHSISPWVSASPNFFTLQPGEVTYVDVTLDIPNTPEAHNVKWGTMGVRLSSEQVDPLGEQGVDRMGMGIVNVFQLNIYLFQTPPSIIKRSAEIYDFKTIPTDSLMTIMLASENTSPSILNCRSYLEYTNLSTGYNISTKKVGFTLLPEASREVVFKVPADLPKGKYSVMGVLDYGSSSEIKAAELEMTVK